MPIAAPRSIRLPVNWSRSLQLPGLGHAIWSHFSQNDKDVYFTYNEFTRPPSILRFNIATKAAHRLPFRQAFL